jgi:hypothetical protein
VPSFSGEHGGNPKGLLQNNIVELDLVRIPCKRPTIAARHLSAIVSVRLIPLAGQREERLCRLSSRTQLMTMHVAGQDRNDQQARFWPALTMARLCT